MIFNDNAKTKLAIIPIAKIFIPVNHFLLFKKIRIPENIVRNPNTNSAIMLEFERINTKRTVVKLYLKKSVKL